MNNEGGVITVVVDTEQVPPVVCIVGLVSLPVELAGQEVEQVLGVLPAQQGQPVLERARLMVRVVRGTPYLVPDCSSDIIFLLQSDHLLYLSSSEVNLTRSHLLQVVGGDPSVEALQVARGADRGGGEGFSVGP